MRKDFVLDPVSILRIIFVSIGVKHQTTDVVQIVNIFVQISNIISDVLNGRVQFLEFVLIHLDQSIHCCVDGGEINIRS